MAQHPLAIGLGAREALEGARGLQHDHPAAVQRAAAGGARGAQQLGLQRPVDDVGDPQLGAQQRFGTGVPPWPTMPVGVALTTPSTRAERRFQRFGDARARPSPKRAYERLDQPGGAPAVGVEHREPPAPEPEQRVRDRRARPAGADQQRRGDAPRPAVRGGSSRRSRCRPCCRRSRRPSRSTTVLTAPSAAASSVSSSRCSSTSCLHGWVTLSPSKPASRACSSRSPMPAGSTPELVDVEHAVGVGEAEAGGLVLVQRGAERGADAGADQPDEIGAGSGAGSGEAIMYEPVRY